MKPNFPRKEISIQMLPFCYPFYFLFKYCRLRECTVNMQANLTVCSIVWLTGERVVALLSEAIIDAQSGGLEIMFKNYLLDTIWLKIKPRCGCSLQETALAAWFQTFPTPPHAVGRDSVSDWFRMTDTGNGEVEPHERSLELSAAIYHVIFRKCAAHMSTCWSEQKLCNTTAEIALDWSTS